MAEIGTGNRFIIIKTPKESDTESIKVNYEQEQATIADILETINAFKPNMGQVLLWANGKLADVWRRVREYEGIYDRGITWTLLPALRGGAARKGTVKAQGKSFKLMASKDLVIEAVKKATEVAISNVDMNNVMAELERVGNVIYESIEDKAELVWTEWLDNCSVADLDNALKGIACSNDESIRITKIADSLFANIIGPLDTIASKMALSKEGFVSVLTILCLANVICFFKLPVGPDVCVGFMCETSCGSGSLS